MVSGGITKDDMSESKAYPCVVCSLRAKAKSIMCAQCCKWVQGRCTKVKRVTTKSSRHLTCRKCEGNIGEAVEQEENLCDEVETVRKLTTLITG